MLLPLILAVLDEILIRQRHSAVWSGVVLAVLVFAEFFLFEILAIVAVLSRHPPWWCWRWPASCLRESGRAEAPGSARRHGARRGPGASASLLLAWPAWYAVDGPRHLLGLVWAGIPLLGGFVPANFVPSPLDRPRAANPSRSGVATGDIP